VAFATWLGRLTGEYLVGGPGWGGWLSWVGLLGVPSDGTRIFMHFEEIEKMELSQGMRILEYNCVGKM